MVQFQLMVYIQESIMPNNIFSLDGPPLLSEYGAPGIRSIHADIREVLSGDNENELQGEYTLKIKFDEYLKLLPDDFFLYKKTDIRLMVQPSKEEGKKLETVNDYPVVEMTVKYRRLWRKVDGPNTFTEKRETTTVESFTTSVEELNAYRALVSVEVGGSYMAVSASINAELETFQERKIAWEKMNSTQKLKISPPGTYVEWEFIRQIEYSCDPLEVFYILPTLQQREKAKTPAYKKVIEMFDSTLSDYIPLPE